MQQVRLADDHLLVRLVTCGRHAERERQEQPHQPQEGTLERAEIRAVVFPELRASPPTEAEADVRHQHQHAEQTDDDDATWDLVQQTHFHGFSGSGPSFVRRFDSSLWRCLALDVSSATMMHPTRESERRELRRRHVLRVRERELSEEYKEELAKP